MKPSYSYTNQMNNTIMKLILQNHSVQNHLKSVSKMVFILFLALLSSTAFSQTVMDIITDSPDHNTLEAALIAAELDATLQGEGPFTVFAPTDDAFAALPEGTVEALLADSEHIQRLANLEGLTAHARSVTIRT